MDRRNEAYMMRDKMPGSLDSANRILEFFRTIDTLKVKHMFSCMEGKFNTKNIYSRYVTLFSCLY